MPGQSDNTFKEIDNTLGRGQTGSLRAASRVVV